MPQGKRCKVRDSRKKIPHMHPRRKQMESKNINLRVHYYGD